MQRQQVLFWVLCGAILGLGLGVLGLGPAPLIIGITLALYRMRRAGTQGAWIVLATWGVVGATGILLTHLLADPTRTWYAERYPFLAVPFVMLTMIGVLLGVLERRRTGSS